MGAKSLLSINSPFVGESPVVGHILNPLGLAIAARADRRCMLTILCVLMDLRDTRRILRRIPRLRRIAITGRSMEPKYRTGDWLLVGVGWPITPGCVVVARDPRDWDRLVVKRAVRREGKQTTPREGGRLVPDEDKRGVSEEESGWWVEGDNAAHSTDSREFGILRSDSIVGRVLFRYHRPASD